MQRDGITFLCRKKMTEDDEKIWLEAVEGVKKISHATVASNKKPSKKKNTEISIPFVSRSGFSDDLQLSDFHNVDRSMAKRIKRTKYEVEGVLDLHGYTVDRAFEAVRNFVFEAYNHGKRCVIIVTGKGYGKGDEETDIFATRGVLRDMVPQWLNAQDVRPLILSVSNPPENMGGSGALYIILRRHRE